MELAIKFKKFSFNIFIRGAKPLMTSYFLEEESGIQLKNFPLILKK
jgi:hypothetical protein